MKNSNTLRFIGIVAVITSGWILREATYGRMDWIIIATNAVLTAYYVLRTFTLK